MPAFSLEGGNYIVTKKITHVVLDKRENENQNEKRMMKTVYQKLCIYISYYDGSYAPQESRVSRSRKCIKKDV